MNTIQVHRIKTTLTQNGTLTLDHLPFQAGETVEIIVLTTAPSQNPTSLQDRFFLYGTLLEYHNPLEPLAEQDWDAL